MIKLSRPNAYYPGIADTIARVVASGRYIHGPEEEAFCAAFRSYLATESFVTGCASGTDALVLALRAAGVAKGDRVATPAFAFRANVEAILAVGAIPVFADVNGHGLIDVNDIPPFASAVLCVHLYGRPCDMTALTRFCKAKRMLLIEDCAQAHGALWRGQRVGTFGEAAAFSFYPTKNLGGLGDGGAVVSRFPITADHGLDEIQAAVLRHKLAYLDVENSRRRFNAERYDALLPHEVKRPPPLGVYHQYVIRAPWRDALQTFLASRGIETKVHYPVPVHEQFGIPAHLPMTEFLTREILSLPVHPWVTGIEYVCRCVQEFYERSKVLS